MSRKDFIAGYMVAMSKSAQEKEIVHEKGLDWSYYREGYISSSGWLPMWTFYYGKAGRYNDVHLMILQKSDNEFEWSVECNTRTLESGYAYSLSLAMSDAKHAFNDMFPRNQLWFV